MRVLLISYYYPPDGAVGALRPAKVAAAFRSRGHEVTVLAAGPSDKPIDADGVRRVRPRASPRDWYMSLKRRMSRATVLESVDTPRVRNSSAAGFTPPNHVPAWKRYLASLLWLPDDAQGFIPSAYRAARELHAARPFDLLYTSAPPFSTHIAGLAIRRPTGIRWVAEYRDPWLDGPGKPMYVRSRAADAAEAWLERRSLAAADEIVVVTAAAARMLGRRRAQMGRREPILALSGIDRIDTEHEARVGPIRIMYVGNLYLARNPRPFLSSLSRLRSTGRLPAQGIAIEFIGDCRWFFGASVEAMARELGIADLIQFRDRVPHAEVASAIRSADLLLLLAQGQPAQVPNKLYEYLGTRKPILAYADADGETATMLRAAGGHSVVTEIDAETSTEIVCKALASSRSALASDARILSEWTTDNQMAHLVRSLERVR